MNIDSHSLIDGRRLKCCFTDEITSLNSIANNNGVFIEIHARVIKIAKRLITVASSNELPLNCNILKHCAHFMKELPKDVIIFDAVTGISMHKKTSFSLIMAFIICISIVLVLIEKYLNMMRVQRKRRNFIYCIELIPDSLLCTSK